MYREIINIILLKSSQWQYLSLEDAIVAAVNFELRD